MVLSIVLIRFDITVVLIHHNNKNDTIVLIGEKYNSVEWKINFSTIIGLYEQIVNVWEISKLDVTSNFRLKI